MKSNLWRYLIVLCLVLFSACATTAETTEAGDDAVCGDGTVAGTEECDDGNTTADDGCSATCTDESAGGGNTDPGTSLGDGLTAQSANLCDSVGGIAYSIYAQDADNIWLGCAGAIGGLFKSTDGGTNFTQVGADAITGITGTYVHIWDIEADGDGNVLICGSNNEVDPGEFLYRYDVAEDTYTSLADDDIVTAAIGGSSISACGSVWAIGDSIVFDSNTGNQVLYSTDNGATWGYEYLSTQLAQFTGDDTTFYGAGGVIADGPAFWTADTTFTDLTMDDDIDSNKQEARAGVTITTDDSTLIMGGANSGDTDLWIIYSENGGTNWSNATITTTHNFSFIRGLDCVSATVCLAVGDYYPASDGGFILISEDAGHTWTDVEATSELPTLYSITSSGNTAWLAGDGGNVYTLDVN